MRTVLLGGVAVFFCAAMIGCVRSRPDGMSGATSTVVAKAAQPELTDIVRIRRPRPTGVAVSAEGRMFICFPRWSPDVKMSVGELFEDGSLQAYPNEEWNSWEAGQAPEDRLVCVQSVWIDAENYLWILDAASPNMDGVVRGGPKLLRVHLGTNRVVQTVRFDETVAPAKSYLNDVRVDTTQNFAYITESGLGSIIVTDLSTGTSRRALYDDPSAKSENRMLVVQGHVVRLPDGTSPQIHADGIALSRSDGYLYYHALTASRLYRIHTKYLRDATLTPPELSLRVERLEATGAADGMVADNQGRVYITSLEDSSIKVREKSGGIRTLVCDNKLSWPDSMAIGPEGWLYVTTSQIQLLPRFNDGNDATESFRVLKMKLPE